MLGPYSPSRPPRPRLPLLCPHGGARAVTGSDLGARRPGRATVHSGATRDNAALLRDANRSFRSGDLSSALVLARRAAREGAGGKAHLIMGKIFYAQNQLVEAQAEFEKARQADPGAFEAVRYLDLVRKDLERAGR